MTERNTLGIPTLHPARVHSSTPSIPELLVAMEQQRRDTEFWLRQIANIVDEQKGNRGTPYFLKDVDIGGNRLTNVGKPSAVDDVQLKGLSLGREGFEESWNAEGKPIRGLPAGEDQDASVNVAQIDILIKDKLLQVLPIGVILLWSGAVAAIPTGWALCDGTVGTPDLRDRFVVGAGSTYNPADTGGAATINIAHTHSADGTLATDAESAHTHASGTLTTDTNAAAPSATTTVDNDLAALTVAVASDTHTHSHSHAVNAGATAAGSAHSHDVTGNTSSSLSAAQSVLNPYYALAYIMRIS